MKVLVLRGGPSNQYELSLESGLAALRNLGAKHHISEVFIDRQGVWHQAGVPVSKEEVLRHADVVVNALHGPYGEDGKVQSELEHFKVPYTGARPFAAATSMNKILTKDYLSEAGLPVVGHVYIENDNDLDNQLNLAFPKEFDSVVVKAIDGGDSLGVVVVDNVLDLRHATLLNLAHGRGVLVEPYLHGQELKCAVVEGFRDHGMYKLLPIEIEKVGLEKIYYPYRDSYRYHVPARLSQSQKQEVMDLAARAHQVLGLGDYSMTDIIWSNELGPVILEVNALPLLGEDRHLAHALRATGANMHEFFEHLVRSAR